MTPYSRNFLLATAAVTAVTVAALIFVSSSFAEHLLVIVSVLIMYPCIMAGVYLYLEGGSYKWISGIDWLSLTEQERISVASRVGLYMAIGCTIICWAIVLMLANFVIGIVLIAVGIAIMAIPYLSKEAMKRRPFIQRSAAKKAGVFVAVSVIAIVPTLAIGLSEFTAEAVIVEFEENGLHVKAPMVDEHFDYDKIEQLNLDPDFEKGMRIAGYATPTICSGTFSNKQFGDYTLASYTNVDPCISFSYDGEYYAFNQSDSEKTQKAYDELLERIS